MLQSKRQETREKEASISTENLHIGNSISFHIDCATYQDGTTRNIEVVKHPGAVIIIPITSNGDIVFIKQYRRVIDKIITELPAGTIEKNEDPISCAYRELEEETGFIANELTKLNGFFPSPSFCTEYIHIFVAQNLKKRNKKL